MRAKTGTRQHTLTYAAHAPPGTSAEHRACFTPKRSLVRTQYRPPVNMQVRGPFGGLLLVGVQHTCNKANAAFAYLRHQVMGRWAVRPHRRSPSAMAYHSSGLPGGDLPRGGLQVLELDPDGALATAVRREGAGCDPAPDRLDRDRHGLGSFLEAEVDRDGSSLSHRNAPPLA